MLGKGVRGGGCNMWRGMIESGKVIRRMRGIWEGKERDIER